MPTFFSDRDLANVFPDILESAGLRVERHRGHFRDDTPDEEWLREVARRGWVALTHNKRIRYTPNQVATVFAEGLALIVLVGHASTRELADNFVRTISRVEQFVEQHTPPYIAKLYRASPTDLENDRNSAGRIEMWLNTYP